MSESGQRRIIENKNLQSQTEILDLQNRKLFKVNEQLIVVKDQLEKDNRSLKNPVDAIRLKITIDGGKLLQYEDSEMLPFLTFATGAINK